jgi:hypothetical protein
MSARQLKKKQTASKAIHSVLKALEEELARLRAARDLLLEDTHRAVPRAYQQRAKPEAAAGSRGSNGHVAKAVARAS